MPDTLLGWHLLPADGLTVAHPAANGGYCRRRQVVVGETLTVRGPLVLCKHGLHASERALDALRYAPGPIVCRVKLSGQLVRDDDKACATRRTCLAMIDASGLLHEFACWCAETALYAEREAGREPDARSWAALEVKRRWLRGEATAEELAAARAAASAAASAAFGAAVGAAVGAAARATSRAASWAAASAASWAAAGAGTWDAARAVARATQTAELERRLLAAMGLEVTS